MPTLWLKVSESFLPAHIDGVKKRGYSRLARDGEGSASFLFMRKFILMTLFAHLCLPIFAGEEKVTLIEEEIVIDTDKDGKISRDEYRAAQVEYLMKKYDTDNDGVIGKEEIKKVNSTKTGTAKGTKKIYFQDLDKNKDGRVSSAEVERAIVKQKKTDWYFDTLDADKDAHINHVERPKDRPTVGGLKIAF